MSAFDVGGVPTIAFVPKPTNWICAANYGQKGSGTASMTNGTIYAQPFILPSGTLTTLSISVNTAQSGATVRAALAEHSPPGQSCPKNATPTDLGSIDVSSTGEKTLTSLGISVNNAVYWILIAVQGSPGSPVVLAADAANVYSPYIASTFSFGARSRQSYNWDAAANSGALPAWTDGESHAYNISPTVYLKVS